MRALMVILIGKAKPGWAGISGDRPLFSGVDSLDVEIYKGGSQENSSRSKFIELTHV